MPVTTEQEKTLTLVEAALELGLPYQTAHNLLLRGLLEGSRIRGTRWVVTRESVDRVRRERQAVSIGGGSAA